jgi:hypothetical protein
MTHAYVLVEKVWKTIDEFPPVIVKFGVFAEGQSRLTNLTYYLSDNISCYPWNCSLIRDWPISKEEYDYWYNRTTNHKPYFEVFGLQYNMPWLPSSRNFEDIQADFDIRFNTTKIPPKTSVAFWLHGLYSSTSENNAPMIPGRQDPCVKISTPMGQMDTVVFSDDDFIELEFMIVPVWCNNKTWVFEWTQTRNGRYQVPGQPGMHVVFRSNFLAPQRFVFF